MTQLTIPEQVCDTFTADTGGAHPWCTTCGWQAQHHTYTVRFQAYATAHGRTPGDMVVHDSNRYPGGRMAGFTTWLAEQWAAFGIPMGSRTVTDNEQAAFDDWLTGVGS